MDITLYHHPRSPSARVLWALEELQAPYRSVRVNLEAGEHRTPEFRRINPNAAVPAMVVDGVPVFESLAMLLLLGERLGVERGLWPARDDARLGPALAWSTWAAVTLEASLLQYYFNTVGAPPEQRSASVAASARKALDGHLAVLEGHLKGRAYMLGEGFTLVDVAVASMMGLTASEGVVLDGDPRTQAWLARCKARPAMAAVLAART
jgi:glutathione S-transferase